MTTPFSPSQLCFLVRCLDETAGVPGSVVEIGCAYGHTTVFLEKHLGNRADNREYGCIDTFAGFTDDDSAFERRVRGKSSISYERSYSDASLESFRRTLENNGVTRVKPVQADIKSFDLATVGAVSFCLIDVVLYLPVKMALEKVVAVMGPGGIVVVDDCQEHPMWDGALQAYQEFTAERNLTPVIVEGQFGLIRI